MDDTARLILENRKVRERCKELEEAEENYQLSQTKCQSLTEQLDVLESDKENLQQTNNLLNEELLTLKDKFEEGGQEKCHLEKELQETERKLTESTLKLEELRREIETSQIQTSKSMTEQAQIVTRLKQEIQAANSTNEKLLLDIKELSGCLANADTEVEKKKKANEELADERNKAIKEIKEKEVQIKNLKQELSDASLSTDDTVKAMLESKTLREKNKKITDELISTLNENKALQAKNEEYENQIKEMDRNLEQAAENIRELEDNKHQCTKRTEELEQILEDTKKALEETTSEKEHLTESKLELEKSVEDLTTKHSTAQHKLDVLISHLTETVQQKDELKKQLEDVNELKASSLEQIQDTMKSVLAKIATTSEEFFQQLQQSKQQIDEQYLKRNLDDSGKE